MDTAFRIGLVGCGHVSEQYLEGFRRMPILDVVGCYDIDADLAATRAREFGIGRVFGSLEELLRCDDIQILVNLTPPKMHAMVTGAALESGKHVYSEKPLATSLDEARALLDLADRQDLRLACAPDTVLGSGLQTTRKILDDGWIGRPVGVGAYFLSHGIEHFHPNPAAFYGIGAGPLLDVGPYYLTALVHLLGPIARVSALSATPHTTRIASSPGNVGAVIDVETPTYISASLEFQSGAIGTLVATFDVWATRLPYIEIYGEQGTISSPDPDSWTGEPEVRRYGPEEARMLDLRRDVLWSRMPPSHPADAARGVGVEDLAISILNKEPHRMSAEVAFHVLDVSHCIMQAAREGRVIEVMSSCVRPAPLMPGVSSRHALPNGV